MHITVPMFQKGRSFVLAGGLVKAYEGHRFVYLHLLCQGVECIGKALLLEHDYVQYEPKLRNYFRHDLEVLISEVNQNSGKALFTPSAMTELTQLNAYYKRQSLRYGAAIDFDDEARVVSADNLHRELVESLTELNVTFGP